MTLYVYTAPRCERESQTYGQQQVVANVRSNIEGSQHPVGFTGLYGSAFLKKDLGRNFRLIGYRLLDGEDQLLVLATILKRGDSEYGDLLEWAKNSSVPRERFVEETEEDLRQVLEEARKEPEGPKPLPPPTGDEVGWLYPFSGISRETGRQADVLVLETRAWVVAMQSGEVQEGMISLHRVLDDAANHLEDLRPVEEEHGIRVFEREGVGFRYAYYPNQARLLLVRPILHGRAAGGPEVVEEELREVPSPAALQRRAIRSYPLYMILDYESWSQIQKDEEANLALSPEEADLVDSIRHQEKGFPLFINGRAGSGKSTMLHYLAAELIDFGIRRESTVRPLFITFTPELKNRARETMERLLLRHHRRLLESLNPDQVRESLEASCVVFKDYLLSRLPAAEVGRFSASGYVDYSRFAKLWQTSFSHRQDAHRYSLEVSWHVIRSHIKGARTDLDSDLDPSEYSALGKRRRSVTQDSYQRIYEHVWRGWYQQLCEEEGLWDDQDLAAFVLNGDSNLSLHPAVFCDEAQDFTPLELQILIRLCLFSQRTLQPEQLGNVPIAFAGDPLQTINPTGFQWEAVKADYHDALRERLDPLRRGEIEFNYKELDFNYRSTEEIVGFCNLIQLLRAALFEQRVRPQRAWDDARQAALPSLLSADSARVQEQIVRRSDLAKILPCHLGQESWYVEDDDLLVNLPKDESSDVYHNVFSPMRAKGLEFENVLLYRFAESAPEGLSRLLESLSAPEGPEERLEYEYFLNNLYVAASRAREQLHVVDGEGALANFWRFSTDEAVVRKLLERVEEPELWQSALRFPAQPAPEEWGGEPVDPASQASVFERTGREQRDPYLLRQAVLSYRNAKLESEADRCRALAFEYEDRWREAGDVHRGYEVGMKKNAFRCYWEGRHWDRLVDLSAELPSSRLESRAADFMQQADGSVTEEFVEALSRTAGEEGWLRRVARDASWAAVFEELGRRLSTRAGGVSNAQGPDRLAERVDELLADLEDVGLEIDRENAAEVAYRARKFSRAVELFEAAGLEDREAYLVARAESSPYPESLRWWKKADRPDRLVSEWRDNEKQLPDERELVAAIAEAAAEHGDLDASLVLSKAAPGREQLEKLVLRALDSGRLDVVSGAGELLVDLAVASADWDLVVDLGRNRIRGRTLKGSSVSDRFVPRIVKALADSEELSKGEHRRVAEFLEEVASREHLPVRVIGSAFERTGHFVKSIKYFESLLNDSSLAEAERVFVQERLIKIYEKYASFLEAKGQAEAAVERRKRLGHLETRFSKRAADLPEFPTSSPSPVQERRATRTQWAEGPIRVVASPQVHRMNATHDERVESFTLDIGGGAAKIESTAHVEEIERLTEDVEAWHIGAWQTSVRLRVTEGRYRAIVLRRGSAPVTFDLGNPESS